ncbi:hypothetical protein [Psychromonas sp. SP041]|uniref:hypothetical protein n=1 Tax=Psychromonas sp. SP041 TaxID=1365007 RepID=UPI0004298952|nr:hypothetical protein [Psychromonas sp. SP041]
MKKLKPVNNPAKIDFWAKWVGIALTVSVVCSYTAYKAHSVQKDHDDNLSKSAHIDAVALRQYARAIQMYEHAANLSGGASLSTFGTIDRIETELKNHKLIAITAKPLLGSRIEVYKNIKFVGFEADSNQSCEIFNHYYQQSKEKKIAHDIDKAYEIIDNKSDPFCVINSVDLSANSDIEKPIVIISIRDQVLNNSMNIYN